MMLVDSLLEDFPMPQRADDGCASSRIAKAGDRSELITSGTMQLPAVEDFSESPKIQGR